MVAVAVKFAGWPRVTLGNVWLTGVKANPVREGVNVTVLPAGTKNT
jgi:hypothetical protein